MPLLPSFLPSPLSLSLFKYKLPDFNFIHRTAITPSRSCGMNANGPLDCFKCRSEQDTSFHFVRNCHFLQGFFGGFVLIDSVLVWCTALLCICQRHRRAVQGGQKGGGPFCKHLAQGLGGEWNLQRPLAEFGQPRNRLGGGKTSPNLGKIYLPHSLGRNLSEAEGRREGHHFSKREHLPKGLANKGKPTLLINTESNLRICPK